jgi:hypothetical protein
MGGPRHSPEEFVRRSREIYERVIKPTLSKEDIGKYLAIDIESGNYELDKDDWAACDRLYKRCPDAQPFLMRVGYPAAAKLGGGWPAGSGESLDWWPEPPPKKEPPKSIWCYPHEEVLRRAKDIYERVIKPALSKEDIGKFIAIDIESEDYEVDGNDWAACHRLSERSPGVPPFLMRIGYPTPHKLGGGWPPGSGESF